MSLNCLVLGDTSFKNVFSVDIGNKNIVDGEIIDSSNLKISHLKTHIWNEKKDAFQIKDPDSLNLWKVDISEDNEYKLKDVSTEKDIEVKLSGEMLNPNSKFEFYFPHLKNTINIHIIVQVPAATGKVSPNVLPLEQEITSARKRKWAVNSAILQHERDIFYYVDPEGNDAILESIWRHENIALYGARASGKTTRAQQIRKLLENEGFICIYVSLKQVNIETEESFWMTLGSCIEQYACTHIDFKSASVFESVDDMKIISSDYFHLVFMKRNWNSNVVIIIDDFDKMCEANDDVKISCLANFRCIRNSRYNYAIGSIIAIGTSSRILDLNPITMVTSPFSFSETFQNPNFTFNQVQDLYRKFATDYDFTIDPEVIKDIYKQTSGHAGLVCLFGHFIQNKLLEKIGKDNVLTFSSWFTFSINSLQKDILDHATYRKMIEMLNKTNAKPAIDLLRTRFLGFFDNVRIFSDEGEKLEFLVDEGVLIEGKNYLSEFKMSSAFVDGLIQRQVIPNVYKSSPESAVPQKDDDDESLDILNILQTAIQFFDKDIISNAVNFANNGSQKNMCAPRESVYSTELNRILVNWLIKKSGYEVTGRHLVKSYGDKEGKYKYSSNIVIITEHQKTVLELLATATEKELNEHSERVLEYAEKLSVNDIWLVHFTREDGYANQKLQWPSDNRINVVHFFHDSKFENVLMNIRYIDSSGTIKYIVDQVIPLQS
ncbi:hypothetical protein RhiirC2_797199 [Rhizophagus irregularis]|uniref:Crinkler effector protein N-terminal domain-containing protein n=1 Tax=Rhizophagus irregularis TaxID=588596 RepID=A0A2N1M8D8_9GLOM|nr:hypothetical protein RhiirC2_797199 [Rhizophagus irregularis]